MRRFTSVLAALLVLAVLGSALALVWSRHQNRMLFVQLSNLQKERDALNIDFGRLEIEQATWAEPSRVERVARERLGMIDAPAEVTRMVQP